jgi:flagellar FliL protein
MAAAAALAKGEDEEVPVAEGEGEALPTRKKWSGKRIALIAGIPLFLIIAAGAGLYFTGIIGGSKKAEAPAPKVETASVYVDLPDILVNLEPSGKQPRFLKTSVSLEVGSDADAAALKKVMPRLIDQFQTYLRGLRVDDLHGSAGVYRLRQELLARVAQAADPVAIRDVLFRELLVQ